MMVNDDSRNEFSLGGSSKGDAAATVISVISSSEVEHVSRKNGAKCNCKAALELEAALKSRKVGGWGACERVSPSKAIFPRNE